MRVLAIGILSLASCVQCNLVFGQLYFDHLVDELHQVSNLLDDTVMRVDDSIDEAKNDITGKAVQSVSRGLAIAGERTVITAGAEVRTILNLIGPIGSRWGADEKEVPEARELRPFATVSSISPSFIELQLNEGKLLRRDLPPTMLIGGYGFSDKKFEGRLFGKNRPSDGEDVSRYLYITSPMLLQVNTSEGNGIPFAEGDERLEISVEKKVRTMIPVTWTIVPLPVLPLADLILDITTGKDNKDEEINFDVQVWRNDQLISTTNGIGAGAPWETGHHFTQKLKTTSALLPGRYRLDVYVHGVGEWDAAVKLIKKPPQGEPIEGRTFDRHFDPEANNAIKKHLGGAWRW